MHAGDCDSLHLPLRWYGGCIIFDSDWYGSEPSRRSHNYELLGKVGRNRELTDRGPTGGSTRRLRDGRVRKRVKEGGGGGRGND